MCCVRLGQIRRDRYRTSRFSTRARMNHLHTFVLIMDFIPQENWRHVDGNLYYKATHNPNIATQSMTNTFIFHSKRPNVNG